MLLVRVVERESEEGHIVILEGSCQLWCMLVPSMVLFTETTRETGKSVFVCIYIYIYIYYSV